MRNFDRNSAENYIRKHERFKRWLVFALCISLLTGTVTLYMLNKPATAMTQEGAASVGLVLDTADSTFESELIAKTEESKEEGDDTSVEELVVTDEVIEAQNEQSGDDGDDTAEEVSDENVESDEDGDTQEEENAEETETETEKPTSEEQNEEVPEEVQLTADVVLTVSYVDENGEALADDKEISLTDSIDFASEAREIEGYTFFEATVDGTAITVITAMRDAEDHKYYQLTLSDGSTLDVTENKTVVLTYKKIVEVEEQDSVKLNARYVDRDDEDIADPEEILISEEKKLTQDQAQVLDGYFYLGAFYEEKEIVAVSPVFAEANEEQEKAIISGYKFTTFDGEEIEATEDAEIKFTYLKACEDTEFVYSDDKVTVKIVTATGSVFPEGIELTVTEVTPDISTYNYTAYMDALNDNADSIADASGLNAVDSFSENNTLLYDIAFMYEGKEIQPAEGAVTVSIVFNDNQLKDGLAASSEEEIAVVHLPIKEDVKESFEITSTAEATDITASDIKVETLTDISASVDNAEEIEFSTESFSIFAVSVYQDHEPGTDTFESVLGDAINFGIVADTFIIGESETNFAVKTVRGTNHSGNDLTNPVEQTFIAGVVEDDIQVKGEDAYFIVPKEYTSKIRHANETGGDHLSFDTAYTTKELNELVDDMLRYGREASKDLYANSKENKKANVALTQKSDQKYYLDLTGYAAGTYYVEINDSNVGMLGQSGWLNINKNDDQTVVFNVTASGNVYLSEFVINGTTTSDESITKKTSNASKTIIWNMINTQYVETTGSTTGVFISGQTSAKWMNQVTSSGWLIFPEVEIGNGEWHNTYDQIKQISGSAQFQAYKTIDDKAATASGFKFGLYKKESDGSWTWIQTVENDTVSPHNIFFDSITFGGDSTKTAPNYQYVSATNVGDSQSFVYRIVETNGATDSDGNAYYPDETAYYAKVTATLQYMNEYSKKGFYYRVSAPEYYFDEACTQSIGSKIPTFNNTTIEGHVGILLRKYLNDADPGDLKFSFKVRALTNDGTDFKTLTEYLVNNGSRISYAFDFDASIVYKGCIYLVITENDITNDNSGVTLTKDKGYIIARVNNPGKDNQSVDYFKYSADDPNVTGIENNIGNKDLNRDGVPWLAGYVTAVTKSSANKLSEEKAAFYNTGTAMLRIHKMVINDWGADFVRDGEQFAMLEHCTFRITNNSTGDYIVFTSFVGGSGETRQGCAVEYDKDTHQPTGKTFPVTYNRSAQWTVSDLPAGVYTVEEVGDDITFTYDPSTNTISYIYDSNLSRVTKYDLTEDTEGATKIGTGGDNHRVVYSIDLQNHYDQGPSNVKVGDPSVDNKSHTQTVQVCNYYSLPIGPIKIAKNFTGGQWKEDMEFSFTIEPVSYTARDSAGNGISIPTGQPMPIDGNTITLKGSDAHRNEDGSYSAIGMFSSIPYRFEGTYYYKITENKTGLGGVIYDETEYFVEIKVSKKHTEFNKTYNGENMANQDYYNTTGQTTVREDFYYLGADIRYATDIAFSNVVAQCELYLGTDPNTGMPQMNEFQVHYTYGNEDGSSVAFNNSLSGELTVTKKWFDKTGNPDTSDHSPLTLYIWQRKAGETNWTSYSAVPSVTLSSENGWTQTVGGLLIEDADGNRYEYCIKEPDSYLETFAVAYSITSSQGSAQFFANDAGTITVDGVTYKDPGYSLGVDGNGSFGTVEVSNTEVKTNTIPSTGGMGTQPFALMGGMFIMLSLMGMLYFRKKKEA